MCLHNKFFLLSIFLLLYSIELNESAKILAIFPFPGKSQYILVQPYLNSLVARGHELTVINAYPSKENQGNYRDIPVLEVLKIWEVFMADVDTQRNEWSELSQIAQFYANITRVVLKNLQVQELLKVASFDLIIIESNLDALYSFAEHFGAPVIGVSSYGSDIIINEVMGNPTSFSYIPAMGTGFTERMSYSERLHNVITQLITLLNNRWIYLPSQQKLLKQYMPHIKQDVWTLRRNLSLHLLNQHFSLTFGRPNAPTMIEVGGFQVSNQTQPLPSDLREIIDNSAMNIIYFSMGSNVKSEDFPLDTLQAFNAAFSELPYTILWKFENPKLPGKPANVYISPWFPQTDILAEAKVKLFITHGGLLSTFEAVHHGKPILGIPIFFDQNSNVNNAKKQGFALRLDLTTLTRDNLKNTILELMTNPSYGRKAKEISMRFHDQPIKPLDAAIFWTEYVLRHRGAAHLRNPAQSMSLWHSYSLDTLGLLFVAAIVVLSLIILCCLKICKLFAVRSTIKQKIN